MEASISLLLSLKEERLVVWHQRLHRSSCYYTQLHSATILLFLAWRSLQTDTHPTVVPDHGLPTFVYSLACFCICHFCSWSSSLFICSICNHCLCSASLYSSLFCSLYLPDSMSVANTSFTVSSSCFSFFICHSPMWINGWLPMWHNNLGLFLIIRNITPRSHNRNAEYCLLGKKSNPQQPTTNTSIPQSVPPPLPPFQCPGVFCGSLISTTDTKVESNYTTLHCLMYDWKKLSCKISCECCVKHTVIQCWSQK